MRDSCARLALVALVLSGGLGRPAGAGDAKVTVEQVRAVMNTTRNLSGRDLRGMNLTGLDLSRVDLRGAAADASQANLSQADLRGDDDLTEANLRGTELRETVMPPFPMELPARRSLFHKTKDAHWGTTVTGPAWRLLRRQEGVFMELTSRSANVLRKLVG